MPKLTDTRKISVLLTLLSMTVAILLLGYSSYGWMTMSKSVKAVGQNVTVSAPSGLYISITGQDDDWHQTVTVDLMDLVKTNAGYKTQEDSFFILPASSLDGSDGTIWQTSTTLTTLRNQTDVDSVTIGAGRAVTWNAATGANEGHYIDVPLYFKTTGEPDLLLGLDASSSILSVGGSSNVNQTVRVAFLNWERTAPSYGTDPLVYALPGASDSDRTQTVLKQNGATWDLVEPMYTAADLSKGLLSLPGADYSQTPAVTGSSKLYARIWIEGQDPLCVASIGSKTFSVSLSFTEANLGG